MGSLLSHARTNRQDFRISDPLTAGGIVPRFSNSPHKGFALTHWGTLTVGLGTFVVLVVECPDCFGHPLRALVGPILAASRITTPGLRRYGVAIWGELPGWGSSHEPFRISRSLCAESLGGRDRAGFGLRLGYVDVASFASKNRYDIDADREFAALGAANIVSALFRGLPGARRFVNCMEFCQRAGRTPSHWTWSAGTIPAVLLFFNRTLCGMSPLPLWVPCWESGVFFGWTSRRLTNDSTRIDRKRFALSVLANVGVVAVGAIHAILVAVALRHLAVLVKLVSRPNRVRGESDRRDTALTTPFLVIRSTTSGGHDDTRLTLLRFQFSIVFFTRLSLTT